MEDLPPKLMALAKSKNKNWTVLMKTIRKVIQQTPPIKHVSAALVLSSACTAQAAMLSTGNPNLDVRFDNTLRYNAAVRVEGQNDDFLDSPGYDDTENKFDSGDLVTNRVDLISELDVVYKSRHGFRLSAAAWYDHAYRGDPEPNPDLANSGNYDDNEYNSYVDRYMAGPSGEILDAFVFTRFEVGDIGFGFKAGQHNVYWGESLFSIGNSIAFSQGPVDTIKSAASPGSEAKELFMPIEQVSGSIAVNREISLGFHYALDWEPFRIVPGGTYFASSDGARSDLASAPVVRNGDDFEPEDSYGDYGINLRWSPWQLGGTFGLYYRKFDEKLPWSFLQFEGSSPVPSVRLAYARDTELFGVSLTQTVGTVSVSTEVSHRSNTALVSETGTAFVAPGAEPEYESIEGARGDTWHALINGTYLLPQSPFWESGTLLGEVVYNRLERVTSDPQNRFEKAGEGCTAVDQSYCVTSESWGVQARFTPEWPQLFAGWNVAMPINASYGLKGNSPTPAGTNEDVYKWSIGLTGTYRYKHNFSLVYADTEGRYETSGGAITDTIGGPVQNDHGHLSFTYDVTF